MADRDTTVVERGGNSGLIFLGIVLLIAVVIGGYFLLQQNNAENARTTAVTQTADKVGDAAKDATGK